MTENRVSVLKSRLLKNPFVMCGRIKNIPGSKQDNEDEDYVSKQQDIVVKKNSSAADEQ